MLILCSLDVVLLFAKYYVSFMLEFFLDIWWLFTVCSYCRRGSNLNNVVRKSYFLSSIETSCLTHEFGSGLESSCRLNGGRGHVAGQDRLSFQVYRWFCFWAWRLISQWPYVYWSAACFHCPIPHSQILPGKNLGHSRQHRKASLFQESDLARSNISTPRCSPPARTNCC